MGEHKMWPLVQASSIEMVQDVANNSIDRAKFIKSNLIDCYGGPIHVNKDIHSQKMAVA